MLDFSGHHLTSKRQLMPHLVVCHEAPGVISAESIGGLRQIIGTKAEELRLLGQARLGTELLQDPVS